MVQSRATAGSHAQKTTIETEFKTITGKMLPARLEHGETEFMRTSVKHPPMIKRKDGKGKDRDSIQGSSSSPNNDSFLDWSFVIKTTPLAEKQELVKYTTCLGSVNHDISADEEDILLGLEFIVE